MPEPEREHEPDTDASSPESPTSAPPDAGTWRVELLVLALGLMIGLSSLAWPAGRDQGIEGSTAMLLLEGRVPYRDVWSHSPPGGFSLLAAGFVVLGPSPLAIRVIDLGWMLLGAVGLTRLVRREAGWVGGAVAGLLLLLSYYGQGDFWHTAQRDGQMLTPSIWALELARRHNDRAAVCAGLCVGAAALFKPGGAAMLLPVAFAIGWKPRHLGAALAGAAAPALAFIAALVVTGALDECLAGLVEFNRGYASHYRAHADGRLAHLAGSLSRLPVLDRPELSLCVLGLFVPAAQRRWSLAYLGAAALSPVAQASLYPYHLLPLLGPLALLAGLGIAHVYALAGRRRTVALGLATLGLAASAHATLGLAAHGRVALAIARHAMPDGDYNEAFAASREYELVAAHIRDEGGPEDRVLLWGSDPQILLLARRAPADRYLVSFPLVAPWGPREDRGPLVERLRRDPPAWVVVRSGDQLPWLSGTADDSATSLARYPELLTFLQSRYKMVRSSPRLLLLRRSDAR